MKKFRISFLLFSEASGVLAASIYSLSLSFIVQKYVESQYLNSLVSNLSVLLSMIVAVFAGHIVDKQSPWKLILLSDVILLPLFLIPVLLFDVSISLFIISVIVIDIISIIFSELDTISRPVYLNSMTNKDCFVSTIQQISIVDSAFSIIGYLFVFLTISFIKINYYFIFVFLFYLISAVFIFNLPKENRTPVHSYSSDKFSTEMKSLVKNILKSKQTSLYIANLIFMVKNQIIMSLLIFRIGQIDKNFSHIPIIGIGILSSVGIGALLNKILYVADVRLRKLFSIFLISCSTYFTYVVGHIQFVENFLMLGIMIGAIFGTGLPCFGLLSAERMLGTSNHQQGKALSLLRTFSVVITFLLTSCFAIIESQFSYRTIYFDGSVLLSIALAIIFLFLKFRNLTTK